MVLVTPFGSTLAATSHSSYVTEALWQGSGQRAAPYYLHLSKRPTIVEYFSVFDNTLIKALSNTATCYSGNIRVYSDSPVILWRPLASIQFSICYVCTSATTSIDTRKTCPALPAFGMYHFALFSVFGREIVANLPGVAYYTALTVSSTQSVSSNPFRGGLLPLKRFPSKEENRAGFLEFPKVCELLAFERPLAF